jgi:hypothetical protein
LIRREYQAPARTRRIGDVSGSDYDHFTAQRSKRGILLRNKVVESPMAWLFERTVEVAAWVAFVAAWVSLGFTIYWFYLFLATLQADPDYALMRDSAMAAGATVAFALGLGGLACVDRFLFDADDAAQR